MDNSFVIILEYYGNSEDATEYFENYFAQIGNVLKVSDHAFLLRSESKSVEIRNFIENSAYELKTIMVLSVRRSAAWRNTIPSGNDIITFLNS